MENFALIFFVAVLTFLAEKTGFRLLNFGSFFLLLYLGLTSDNIWLMMIYILIGLLIIVFSIFGENE